MTRQAKPVDPINHIVGRRLRLKREFLGINQTVLGEEIGVSRIKIGQFESGNSPVPASTLYKLAQYFKVDVSFFFKEEEEEVHNTTKTVISLQELDPLLNRESISLLKNFGAMNDTDVRKKFAAVMERASELMAVKK